VAHPEVAQLLRYGLVAVVSLAVDFAVLTLAVEWIGLYYLLAAAAGFLAGLLVNFFLAERFAFGLPKIGSIWLRLGSYSIIGLVGLGLTEILMWFQVSRLGEYYLLAKAITTVLVFCWNYLGRRPLYRRRGLSGESG
jgi:putative flippase GtrA